jgi:hypothetical protein
MLHNHYGEEGISFNYRHLDTSSMFVIQTNLWVHLQVALLWSTYFYLGPINVCVQTLGIIDEPCLLLSQK